MKKKSSAIMFIFGVTILFDSSIASASAASAASDCKTLYNRLSEYLVGGTSDHGLKFSKEQLEKMFAKECEQLFAKCGDVAPGGPGHNVLPASPRKTR